MSYSFSLGVATVGLLPVTYNATKQGKTGNIVGPRYARIEKHSARSRIALLEIVPSEELNSSIEAFVE
jgi:hypothetical protein